MPTRFHLARSRFLALAMAGAIAALPLLVLTVPAQAQGPSRGELRMAQDAGAFRQAAQAFVAGAMAGDTEAVMAMLSPSVRARAGDAAVRGMLDSRIVPFFRAARADGTPGRSVTVSLTSDASGNHGFAFYMWAAGADGAPPRPFTLYMVEEGGRIVVANVVPDRLVEGRHR